MTKTFKIQVSALVNGSWQKVTQTGTAKVIDKGFQMQLGDDGYALEVIESAAYAAGTRIYAYSHNVRAA